MSYKQKLYFFGLLSFAWFDNRDVDGDRGIKIGYGQHYRAAWPGGPHPWYYVSWRRIEIAFPYIVWPYSWIRRSTNQLHFSPFGLPDPNRLLGPPKRDLCK